MGLLKQPPLTSAPTTSDHLFPAGPYGFTQIWPDGITRTDIDSQDEPASSPTITNDAVILTATNGDNT